MRASRYPRETVWRRIAIAALAMAAHCGASAPVHAQMPVEQPIPVEATTAPSPSPRLPQPFRIMSWNVATSPYAIAMRKIKSEPPAWRTSFGAERRTIEAPARPQASDITADIVLLQGVINPRAMRRLFPARQWRLIFSPRALETLPKGSVFTAPVSSVEIEAIAIRYREGWRIVGRGEPLDAVDATQPSSALSQTAGLAIRIVDGPRTIGVASATLPIDCRSGQSCEKAAALSRWRAARSSDDAIVVVAGALAPATAGKSCSSQTIEVAPGKPSDVRAVAGSENRLFGCTAELTIE